MSAAEIKRIEGLIERVESFSGFVTEDKNVVIAFENFQEVLAQAMRQCLARAQSIQDDRLCSVYLHEIEYLAQSIKSWAKHVK